MHIVGRASLLIAGGLVSSCRSGTEQARPEADVADAADVAVVARIDAAPPAAITPHAPPPSSAQAASTALLEKTPTCRCVKKVFKRSECLERNGDRLRFYGLLGDTTNHWCEDTYPNDCTKMLECSTGEPGAYVKCPPGYSQIGLGHSCRKLCAQDGGCPPGSTCGDGSIAAQGKRVCIED